ncbi:hypothetical protein [Ferrimicrobium sp.]|uniref:hypothetical protein n=1 Tax=Ferrimicrobium sp. TaxID=2926050 RepID=UPI00260D0C80|nr:hypothetical protein [Ferrimicrobium sp.]
MVRQRFFPKKTRLFRLATVSAFSIGMIGLGSGLAISTSQLASSSNPITTLYAAANGTGNGCTESSPCSLQGALDAVATSTTTDVAIDLVTSGTLTSTSGDYLGGFTAYTGSAGKSFDITIEPAGTSVKPILNGTGTARVLTVQGAGTLNLVSVTIENGLAPAGDNGGGIYASSTLTITNSTIKDNNAGAGGAGGDGGQGSTSRAFSTCKGEGCYHSS